MVKAMTRRRRARRRTQLARAVRALPDPAPAAMLAALAGGPIITGAYVRGDAGVCPVLAMHRAGCRVSAPGFAPAWDRFCGVRRGRARRARPHELAILAELLGAERDRRRRSAAAAAAAERRRRNRLRAEKERAAAQLGLDWLPDDLRAPTA